MPSRGSELPRALIIQLARLGDLLQSLPVITSLRDELSETPLDLLCPSPLMSLGSHFPGISQTLPWNGEDWYILTQKCSSTIDGSISQAIKLLEGYTTNSFAVAYNLNNHRRATLAAHLLGKRVVGPGGTGVLSTTLPPWAEYLRHVAKCRGNNRVHLADALCGLCGVNPPALIPTLRCSGQKGLSAFEELEEKSGVCVALIIGAGDRERRVPTSVWQDWIATFLSSCSDGRILLVGGTGEKELAHALLDRLSPLYLGRIWNACGQTTLPQLAQLLSHCHWVIGSDTGPLHLGAACGTKAMGFYFSRARVHETGPYGTGHWVWQAKNVENQNATDNRKQEDSEVHPTQWPVRESVELVITDKGSSIPAGWSLWSSDRDHRGVYFTQFNSSSTPPFEREQVWQQLSRSQTVDSNCILDLLGVTEPVLNTAIQQNRPMEMVRK